MSSPPKCRRKITPMEEVHGVVRTTRQRLPELDASPAAELSDWHDGMNKIHINEPNCIAVDKGLMASFAETKAQTCGDSNICEGAPKTRDRIICGDGNICEGAPKTMDGIICGDGNIFEGALKTRDGIICGDGNICEGAPKTRDGIICGDGNICEGAPKTMDGNICGDGNICEGAPKTRDDIVCGDGNICEVAPKTRDGIICGDGNICEGSPKTRDGIICGDGNICDVALNLELDKIPEDMIHHIHSLIPVQDAARVACVSRQFLRSWRCYSKLKLTKETLGFIGDKSEGSEIRFINKIDKILNTYSSNGMKVKTLRIDLHQCESVGASYLDRWLWIAVKAGINELSLSLPYSMKKKYYFPYSILFDETATSLLQSLYLLNCIFEPIETLGCFRKLKSLDLFYVQITDTGLQLLLSKSSYLERFQIYKSSEIICLKIPCMLQKLKLLIIKACEKIRVVDISAPNLSTFDYNGAPLEINIRDPSQLKDVYLSFFRPSRILSYVRAKLPSIARNVETLTLFSYGENVNTPMCPDKLLHLKSLEIKLHSSGESPMYDIFSVVSFLDASPALESFILHAERDAIVHECVAGDDLYLTGESVYKHDRLRRVKITGFHSAKSLIKLVIHILENAPSLEALTVDTTGGYGQKAGDSCKWSASRKSGRCSFVSERDITDANSAVEAAGRYIAGRVPSAVEFEVLEPCRRCRNRPLGKRWLPFLKHPAS